MAPRQKSVESKRVDAIIHADKRTNLPTADAQDFVAPEIEAPQKLLYHRRSELDPQLVWRGKDDQDRAGMEVEALPIYIQEKIDPRVLVQALRATTKDRAAEPEVRLFDDFDGLGSIELVEFYKHSSNWSNRLILGDSLLAMASLAEREALRGQVQMIYLDPPYGIKFDSNWQATVRDRDVRDGNLEDAAREVEQIKAFRDTWELGIHSYLSYLRDRLTVARDLLTQSGSIFVQMGDVNVHLVRAVLDEVFGSQNMCGQILFQKTGGFETDLLARNNDYLLWYARDRSAVKFRQLFLPSQVAPAVTAFFDYVEDPRGRRRPLTPEERARPAELDPDLRLMARNPLTSDGWSDSLGYDYEFGGRTYHPTRTTHWKTTLAGMRRLQWANRLIPKGNVLRFVRYWKDWPVQPLGTVWNDLSTGGFVGDTKTYVVQTDTRVVQRCVLMTTDPGDLVLDPTCGSGTTAVVAEQWGRRWITIDTSRVALALARQRLMGATYPYYLLFDSEAGRLKEQQLTGQPLRGERPTDDVRQGFVYERLRHITLKSIANNPDIHDGMSQDAIDGAIARHADTELLYDKPLEDTKCVRVSGPFTAESLSPHRSLSFAPASEPASVRAAATEASAVSFEDTILANLRKAGIQNGRRHERLEFEAVESYGSAYIQAAGVRRGSSDGVRVAISIGPQYGTVGPSFIKAAAREAIKDSGMDLLCILGFAFDPTALGTAEGYTASEDGFANVAAERSLGRVPVLLVRMNADLVMGEDLKKTGAGNLFTVFGEPEIEIEKSSDGLSVEIKGVDVYDPTTGEVRSDDPDRIAMWMIDTTYNGESFFVRHCYFTGGLDPYKRLKAVLRTDVDEEAWASLNRTKSRLFPHPETGRIAVKVINDYGDEVLKVFDV